MLSIRMREIRDERIIEAAVSVIRYTPQQEKKRKKRQIGEKGSSISDSKVEHCARKPSSRQRPATHHGAHHISQSTRPFCRRRDKHRLVKISRISMIGIRLRRRRTLSYPDLGLPWNGLEWHECQSARVADREGGGGPSYGPTVLLGKGEISLRYRQGHARGT